MPITGQANNGRKTRMGPVDTEEVAGSIPVSPTSSGRSEAGFPSREPGLKIMSPSYRNSPVAQEHVAQEPELDSATVRRHVLVAWSRANATQPKLILADIFHSISGFTATS